jgi:hypothetical protein
MPRLAGAFPAREGILSKRGTKSVKKLLLSAALCAFAAPAFANSPNKCSSTAVPGQNLVQLQCDSDNQNADADDLKFFANKQSGLSFLDGSLNKNTSIGGDQNIHVTINSGATATIDQQGNGFAEFDSSLAGKSTNDLRAFTFTTLAGSIIDGPNTVFDGFDGFFGRGQVDPTHLVGIVHNKPVFSWDGDVFMHIVFADSTTLDLSFLGDTAKDDIGSIGFDEPNDPGKLIRSVTMSLDDTGAWNQVKQFEFSVPGAVAAIPELPTWAMGLMGFGLVAGLYRTRREARYAL